MTWTAELLRRDGPGSPRREMLYGDELIWRAYGFHQHTRYVRSFYDFQRTPQLRPTDCVGQIGGSGQPLNICQLPDTFEIGFE